VKGLNVKNNFIKLCTVIAFTASLCSCKNTRHEKSSDHKNRGRDPWVFRLNLDYRPRMLVLALDNELWAAYDMQSPRMYKSWKGGINFNGPMYDDRHNVQPSSKGHTYTIDSARNSPWKLLINGNISVTL
jgi:hypothetical protein